MNKLNAIIEQIFKLSAMEINDSISAATVPTWDSMNYLLFIAEVEKEFGVTFTMDEVLNAKNLGDIKMALTSKGISL